MLIRITEEVADAYDNMAAPEILYPIDAPGHYVIGSVTYENDTNENDAQPVSSGLLIFDVNESDGIIGAELRWLYVAEAYRQRGIANELMTEFYRLLNTQSIRWVSCDVPLPQEYNLLCAFLEEWGFTFQLVDDPIFHANISQLAAAKAFSSVKHQQGKGICSIRQLHPEEWNDLCRQYWKTTGRSLEKQSRSDYEQDVSCVIYQQHMLAGVFLLSSNGRGTLMPELLNCFTGNPKIVIYQLLLYALCAAEQVYGGEGQFLMRCTSRLAVTLVSHLYPDIQPSLTRHGQYTLDQEE